MQQSDRQLLTALHGQCFDHDVSNQTARLSSRRRRRQFIQYRHKERLIQRPLPQQLNEVDAITKQLAKVCNKRIPSNVHGWRKGHSVATAIADIGDRTGRRLSFDLLDCYASIDQRRLAKKVNRIRPALWERISKFLPEAGIPTGFSFSPMLVNLFLEQIDRRFPAVRYADNIMIVADEPERCFLKMQRHLNDLGLTCHEVEVDPTHFCQSLLPPMRLKGGEMTAPIQVERPV